MLRFDLAVLMLTVLRFTPASGFQKTATLT
jgi:hypothetical protein